MDEDVLLIGEHCDGVEQTRGVESLCAGDGDGDGDVEW